MTESAATSLRRPNSKPLPDDTGDTGGFQARSLAAWKRASILHLVDLKKDAWSPTITELRVCPRSDRIVREPK